MRVLKAILGFVVKLILLFILLVGVFHLSSKVREISEDYLYLRKVKTVFVDTYKVGSPYRLTYPSTLGDLLPADTPRSLTFSDVLDKKGDILGIIVESRIVDGSAGFMKIIAGFDGGGLVKKVIVPSLTPVTLEFFQGKDFSSLLSHSSDHSLEEDPSRYRLNNFLLSASGLISLKGENPLGVYNYVLRNILPSTKNEVNFLWKKLPDFRFLSLTEDQLSFNNIKRPVYLSFGSIHYPSCFKEYDLMENVVKEYKDRVEFIFLLYEDVDRIREFKEKKNLNHSFYQLLDSKIIKDLGINRIPTSLVINRDNEVVWQKIGFREGDLTGLQEILRKVTGR